MYILLPKSCQIDCNSLFSTFTEDSPELTLHINCRNQLVGKTTPLYHILQDLSSKRVGIEGKPPQYETQNRNTMWFLYDCAGFTEGWQESRDPIIRVWQ